MVWISFPEYLKTSLSGVLTNELFIGILLALIVTDLRASKYFKWEDHIQKDHFGLPKELLKFLSIIAVYALIIPVSILIMTLVIFFLWLISITMFV